MDKTLAEILGLLCAEGNYREFYANYKEYDKRRGKFYYRKNKRQRIMEFSNKDIKLIHHFIKLLNLKFGYFPNINKTSNELFRVFITKWDIIDNLLSYTKIGCNKWIIHEDIINGNKSIKKAFIRGFFFGDGCLDKTSDGCLRIRFSSVNLKGMLLLSKILIDLSIYNNLNGPYIRKKRKPIFEILVKRESNQRFINCILNDSFAGKKAFMPG